MWTGVTDTLASGALSYSAPLSVSREDEDGTEEEVKEWKRCRSRKKVRRKRRWYREGGR